MRKLKTITNTEFCIITGGKIAPILLSEVKSKFDIDGHIEVMFCSKYFTTSEETKKVKFVIKSLEELGFSQEPTFNEIIEQIGRHKEYKPCQAEDSAALRLAYASQPIGEFVDLIMEEMLDANGNKSIFTLYHDNHGIWLGRRVHSERERFNLKSKNFVVCFRR